MSLIEIIRSVPFTAAIGDPTLLGWVTVGAYLATAVLCVYCAFNAAAIFGSENSLIHASIWTGLGLGMLFLGANKQLDLQSWFTAVIKAIAWENDWYEKGQQLQKQFLIGFALFGIMIAATIGWLIRKQWRSYALLMVGFLVLLRFMVTRIGTFYGVPLPNLSQFTGGFRINWLLELMGAAIIALCAIANLRRHLPKKHLNTFDGVVTK